MYRARKLGPTFKKEEQIAREQLIYPPKNIASLGRVNRAGAAVFYASTHKEAVFFELPDLTQGDELILTFWKTTESMLVNNIGYTERVFQQLGATRAVPAWATPSQRQLQANESTVGLSVYPQEMIDDLLSHDDDREINEAISKLFTKKVDLDEAFWYKLTVALAEFHLGRAASKNISIAGILYPSIRVSANADNIALLPWFVDKHLEFRKAVHIRVKERSEAAFNIEYLDAAHEFDVDGRLNWLGRVRQLKLTNVPAGYKLVGKAATGPDDDGDYLIAQDGTEVHWVFTDGATGKTLQME